MTWERLTGNGSEAQGVKLPKALASHLITSSSRVLYAVFLPTTRSGIRNSYYIRQSFCLLRSILDIWSEQFCGSCMFLDRQLRKLASPRETRTRAALELIKLGTLFSFSERLYPPSGHEANWNIFWLEMLLKRKAAAIKALFAWSSARVPGCNWMTQNVGRRNAILQRKYLHIARAARWSYEVNSITCRFNKEQIKLESKSKGLLRDALEKLASSWCSGKNRIFLAMSSTSKRDQIYFIK